MTQEQIVDNIILDELELKVPNSKETILSKTNRESRRLAMLSIMDDDRRLFEQYKNIIRNEMYCSHYAEETISVLRNYIKVADTEVKEHGEVMTPLTLVDIMLDKLPTEVWNNPNLKWLDPCNGVGTFPSIVIKRLMEGLKNHITDDCERYRHIIENMIYVCEIQAKNMFLFHCAFDREDDHELNSYYGTFLDVEFDKHMKNVWGIKKFDIILGNPPYKNGLHNKFTEKSLRILNDNGSLLFLQPSTLFLSRKEVKKNKSEKFILDILSSNETELTLINGDLYFDTANLFVPLSITLIKNKLSSNITVNYNYTDDKKTITETTIDKIYIHGSTLVYDIWLKIKNKLSSTLEDNLFRSGKIGSHYLTINTLCGNTPKNGKINPDFFIMIYKKDEENLKNLISNIGIPISDKVHTNQVSLNSEEECLNTAKTLMTKFMRFSLSLSKLSGYLTRGELKSVPFMNPTIEWTDEMLFQHFELTQEEIDYINEFIGNWYERDFKNN